jgi:hypothetical protein
MAIYRFVGRDSMVGRIHMVRFGQRYQMPEDVAKAAIKGGCALIPEEDFNALGFTDEDMKIWSDPMVQDSDVPPNKEEAARKSAYLVKRADAQAFFCDMRHELLDPEDKPVVGSPATEQPVIEEIQMVAQAQPEVAEEEE